jgi:toxin YhaV
MFGSCEDMSCRAKDSTLNYHIGISSIRHRFKCSRNFNKQFQELIESSIKFKEKDTPKQYKKHFKPKLLKALQRVVKESIPNDPFSKDFELRGDLSEYRRVKWIGIFDRYRLFFRIDVE